MSKRKVRNEDPGKCPAVLAFTYPAGYKRDPEPAPDGGATFTQAYRTTDVQCTKDPGHPGEHWASWGGSQKWRNASWSGDGRTVTR